MNELVSVVKKTYVYQVTKMQMFIFLYGVICNIFPYIPAYSIPMLDFIIWIVKNLNFIPWIPF